MLSDTQCLLRHEQAEPMTPGFANDRLLLINGSVGFSLQVIAVYGVLLAFSVFIVAKVSEGHCTRFCVNKSEQHPAGGSSIPQIN